MATAQPSCLSVHRGCISHTSLVLQLPWEICAALVSHARRVGGSDGLAYSHPCGSGLEFTMPNMDNALCHGGLQLRSDLSHSDRRLYAGLPTLLRWDGPFLRLTRGF